MNGWIKWTTLYVYATGQSDFRFLRRSINVQRAWTTRVLKKKNLGGSMCKKNKILSLSASSTCALREDYEDSCFTRWRLPSFFSSSFSPSYFFSSLSPGATEAVLCLTFATMRNPLMYYTTTLYAREIFASFFSFFSSSSFFFFFFYSLIVGIGRAEHFCRVKNESDDYTRLLWHAFTSEFSLSWRARESRRSSLIFAATVTASRIR